MATSEPQRAAAQEALQRLKTRSALGFLGLEAVALSHQDTTLGREAVKVVKSLQSDMDMLMSLVRMMTDKPPHEPSASERARS